MTDEERRPHLLDPRAAYALWAASYPSHAHNPLMQAEERAVLSLFPGELSGCTVVDAGCGSGRYLLQALRHGAAHVIGADISREMLERASSELSDGRGLGGAAGPPPGQVNLVQASISTLPLRDRCSDFTVCGLAIGHLPALDPPLAELQRVTRPSGRILCSDFHPLAHKRGWLREFSIDGQRYAVQHTAHSVEDWRRACAALGLRILRILEPSLDRRDIEGPARFDPAALEAPVVIVFELSTA